jgi:hypothetical protein
MLDPASKAPAPPDHYAQTASALALYLHQPEAPQWWTLLDGWLSLPGSSLGHLPFNRFLLLCLAAVMHDRGESQDRLDAVHRGIARCRLGRKYPSNNWTLLAQLCRLLEAPSARNREAETRRLVQMLDAWTTEAGGFIDYPASPGDKGGVATPMAYHHKALFIAGVAARYTNAPDVLQRAQKLLHWVPLAWDGHAYVGGFGRSTHALFGDACLLAGITLLGVHELENGGAVERCIMQQLLERLQRQQRADGLLSLNPAGDDAERSGWDSYMHLCVYNAWLAGILAWCGHLLKNTGRPQLGPMVEPIIRPPSLLQDRRAGLLRYQSQDGVLALLSSSGQPPQAFSHHQVELRYAGGQPFHLASRGRVLCGPAVRIERELLALHPACAGWTAVFLIGDEFFGLTDFEVDELQPGQHGLAIRLSGSPSELHRTSGTLTKRLLTALDWRLLQGRLGRRAALQRRRAGAIKACLVITVVADRPVIHHELALDYDGSQPVTWLNPGGHALVAGDMPCRRQLSIETGACTADIETHQPDPAQLLRVSIEASLPGMQGYCLPRQRLRPGTTVQRLTLSWADPEDST